MGILILIMFGFFALLGIIFAISSYLTINDIHLGEAIKKQSFKIIFSLCFATLAFFIMNNKIGGKILGAILFFAIGWLIALFIERLLNKIGNKTAIIMLEVLLCLLVGIFAVTREYRTYQPKTYYEDDRGHLHETERERDEANEQYFLDDLYDNFHGK